LIVTAADKIEADHIHDWWRTGHSGRFRVVCGGPSIRRHLLDRWQMPAHLAVFIAPGIGISDSSPSARRALRERLALPE